ncbi:hypothetical protein D3C87_1771850 [compost metagenome]
MVLRAAAILAICCLSASDKAMDSSDFCTWLICADVAVITSLNSASTAGSLLTMSACVLAALVSVRPDQRNAACTRCSISLVTASAWACTWADR